MPRSDPRPHTRSAGFLHEWSRSWAFQSVGPPEACSLLLVTVSAGLQRAARQGRDRERGEDRSGGLGQGARLRVAQRSALILVEKISTSGLARYLVAASTAYPSRDVAAQRVDMVKECDRFRLLGKVPLEDRR